MCVAGKEIMGILKKRFVLKDPKKTVEMAIDLEFLSKSFLRKKKLNTSAQLPS